MRESGKKSARLFEGGVEVEWSEMAADAAAVEVQQPSWFSIMLSTVRE